VTFALEIIYLFIFLFIFRYKTLANKPQYQTDINNLLIRWNCQGLVIYSIVASQGLADQNPIKTVGLLAFGQSEIWANFEFVSKFKMFNLFKHTGTIQVGDNYPLKVYTLNNPHGLRSVNLSRHSWITCMELTLDFG
jgi:hypothetical protein